MSFVSARRPRDAAGRKREGNQVRLSCTLRNLAEGVGFEAKTNEGRDTIGGRGCSLRASDREGDTRLP